MASLGTPVHTLLGGSHRDEVKIYADCHAGEVVTSLESYGGSPESYTPEAYAKNAKTIESMGHTFLKFDLYPGLPGPDARKISSPLSSADIQYCAEIAESVRSALKDETGARPLGTVAAAQASATIPNFIALEHHAIGVPWWDNLAKEGPVIKNGYYRLNQKPGLGTS